MYKLPDNIDPSKVFLINRCELEGRIDPNQYHIERKEAIAKLNKNNQLLKLKEVVKNVKTTTTQVSENDIYIGLENIASNTGEYIETKDKLSISSAGIFKKGQILFPKLRPYLNKVYLAEFNGICSTEFHIFKSDTFLNEFLTIYLRSDLIVNQTKHLMTGNTLPRLQTEDINNLPVPNISIEKQQEIVDLYNIAYNLKQQKEIKAKKLLESIDSYLLKELGIIFPEKDNSITNRIFRTSFKEITGNRFESEFYSPYNHKIFEAINKTIYPLKKINQYCDFIPGYAFSSEDYIENSDCYLITIKNISKNSINLNNVTFLPSDFYDKYKGFQIGKNNLLIAMTGATIGKVGIYELENNALLNQRNGIIKSSKMNTYYLMNLLNTEIYQSIILKNSVGGAQPNISEKYITRIEIPIPDIEKQDEIANHIQTIRNQAKQLQEEALLILENAKLQVEKMILG